MTELTHLLAAAYKSERSASRKLAARTGVSEAEALRITLEQSAGAQGLAHLLAQRAALAAAEAARLAARDTRRDTERALARSTTAARHDGPPSPWRAWFDGSAHPNPGRCGIGALLTGPAGEKLEISQPAGYGNSSEAEYLALIALLEAAVAIGAHGLTVHGDSRVVIDDMNGAEDACAPSLRAYRTRAHALLGQVDGACLRWLPRHKNTAADALSQRAVAAFGPVDMA